MSGTGELITDAELVPDDAPGTGSPLDALLGGFNPAAMLAGLGIELPDPDDPTVVDVSIQLDHVIARLDWLAGALLAVAENVPGRFRPKLDPYPPDPYPDA